jgi:hypothetical protein
MEGSKIHLSEAELDLVLNAGIILTKNAIIKKAIALLEQVQERILQEKETSLSPGPAFSVSPKISKGENYLGLPYAVLDYPRIAHGEDLCFIRTMFWWGNFFSSTLQLSGIYKEKNINRLTSSYPLLSANHYFIGINADPWHHHFEATNFSSIASMTPKEFGLALQQQPHIKIAAKWPLKEWNLAATILFQSWNVLIRLIT